jgi:TonB-like protein
VIRKQFQALQLLGCETDLLLLVRFPAPADDLITESAGRRIGGDDAIRDRLKGALCGYYYRKRRSGRAGEESAADLPGSGPGGKNSRAVMLHAIIGKEGPVKQLELISGHPLLVPAALDSVRQWIYQPTLLEGKPVEVDTEIVKTTSGAIEKANFYGGISGP